MSPCCDRGWAAAGAVAAAATLLVACAAPAPVIAPAAPAAPVAQAAPVDTTTGAVAPTDVRVAAPVRVRLAAIDVDAAVVDVGVDGLGEMEVPQDVSTVGWYRFGPGPGSRAGSSVLSGHVDDRVQGPGAFYALSDAAVGDPVQVDLADGTVVEYRVDTVERIDKSELPLERLFARDGAPVITLVTCGGDFDRAARSYRENVVVTAVPAA